MKCSLDISNFLGEISSLFHSVVSLYVFEEKKYLQILTNTYKAFLISPCYSLELCIQLVISFPFFFAFCFSFFSSTICKASSDNHFAFLHFFFGRVVLDTAFEVLAYCVPPLPGEHNFLL